MSIDRLRDFLSKDNRGDYTFYLKTSNPPPIPRDPGDEYHGYQLLNPYLKMPRVRLLDKTDPILVVQGIQERSVEEILDTNISKAIETTEAFVSDMLDMWDQTVTSCDEGQFKRNIRGESVKTLDGCKRSDFFRSLEDKKIVVNDIEYPPIEKTIGSVEKNLKKHKDPVMVLRHGDEQIGNLLTNGGKYFAIDPAYTGWGSPAQALNTLIGSNYIFYYHYFHDYTENESEVNIRYGLTEPSLRTERAFSPIFRQAMLHVHNYSREPFLTKEYLFTNFLRASVGRVARPTDISEVLSQPMVYLALANEFYYQDKL